MPEGPTIVLMKEDLRKYVGEKVISAAGKAKIDKDELVGKILKRNQALRQTNLFNF